MSSVPSLDQLASFEMLLHEHERRCRRLPSEQIEELLNDVDIVALTGLLPDNMDNLRKMMTIMRYLLSQACSSCLINNKANEIFLKLVTLSENKLEEASNLQQL